MAKKKAEDIEIGNVDAFLERLSKDWKDKIINADVFKDGDYKKISTSSYKLDWALGGILEGSMIEIYGENSVGKAQPLDSLVMTPNGPIKMADVKVGTLVSTPDGKSTKVIGIFPQGEIDIYRVNFTDGSEVECCENHLWFTRTLQDRAHNRKGNVRSTKDILSTLSRADGSLNHEVPFTAPVEMNKRELKINPYLLGALLGDGSLSEKTNIRLSSADAEIVNESKNILKNDFNINLKKVGGKTNVCYRLSSYSERGVATLNFKNILKEMNLLGTNSYNKFIPQDYLLSSISDRLEILRGLLDTDGYVNKAGAIVYTSTSEQLAKDVQFIVQSLGGRAKIKEVSKTYSYKEEKKVGARAYNVYIRMSLDLIPFKLQRKVDRFLNGSRKPFRAIKSIELIGKKQAQCILVDSPEHLYLTDNFVVTHNTTLALHIAACAAKEHGKHTFYFDLERKLREAQVDMIGDLDKGKLHIVYPDTAEDTLNKMHEVVMTVPGSVLILDSVGGLLPETEDAEGAEKQSMGTVAKFCAKMVRKLTSHVNRNKNLVIFLNHKTASMQMYGPSDTVHGGKAISNRSAQRIEMSRAMSNLIKNGDDVIGQVVKCKTVKNNLKRPFITVEVPIIYGMGICKELDLYEFAEELGLIQKAGSYVSVMGGENERKADVMNKLSTDDAYRAKLAEEVMKLAP